MIFSAIKSIFLVGKFTFKIIKIILILGFLWLIFTAINSKIGIFSPFVSILKAVFKGIKGAFSLIGLG